MTTCTFTGLCQQTTNKPAPGEMLTWQYRTTIGELQQLQLHASDPSCPCDRWDMGEFCIPKHLNAISSLSAETSAMDNENAQMWANLQEEATDLHNKVRQHVQETGDSEENLDLVGWSRGWRKKLEGNYYAKPTQEAAQVQARMNLQAPFGWPGGKKLLKKRIIALIPPHHTYVEPFAGAASVFWAKEPSQVEVLNDTDPDLMRFYQNVGKVKSCNTLQVARDWERLKARQGKLEPCEFFSAVKCSFGQGGFKRGRSIQTGQCVDGQPHFHRSLSEYQARLAQTHLHNEDWEKTVRRYDAPTTFFYLDPPYHGTSRRYSGGDQDQLVRLAQILPKLKGKWLLSYDDHPDVRVAFKGYRTVRVSSSYTISADSNAKQGKQLLIANYPINAQQAQGFLGLEAPKGSKRQQILLGIALDCYLGGKAGKQSIRAYVEKRIGLEAFNQACAEGIAKREQDITAGIFPRHLSYEKQVQTLSEAEQRQGFLGLVGTSFSTGLGFALGGALGGVLTKAITDRRRNGAGALILNKPKGHLDPKAIKLDTGGSGDYVRERLANPGNFHPDSFRTLETGRHMRVIACPKNHYSKGKCQVGTKTQAILHPRSEEAKLVKEATDKGVPIVGEDATMRSLVQEMLADIQPQVGAMV